MSYKFCVRVRLQVFLLNVGGWLNHAGSVPAVITYSPSMICGRVAMSGLRDQPVLMSVEGFSLCTNPKNSHVVASSPKEK